MSSRRLITFICIAVILLLVAFAAIRIADATSSQEQREAEESLIEEFYLRRDTTTEVLVDMGVVSRSTTVGYDIVLTNSADTTLLLLDYEATCRCVGMELPRKPIAPGESVVAKLWFDSRGEWGSIGNYIAVGTSLEDVNIAVWMSAEIE